MARERYRPVLIFRSSVLILFTVSGVEAEYFHFEYSLFPAYFSRVFIILCLF